MVSVDAVRQIRNFPSLTRFLRDELNWLVEPDTTKEDSTFTYSADELRVNRSAAARLRDGHVAQLRPFDKGQPWGIFLVEFNGARISRTALRQVLRGLVSSRTHDPSVPAWQAQHLLFVCATDDWRQIGFAHFDDRDRARQKLSIFDWKQGDTYIRTLCDLNLPELKWPEDDGRDAMAWIANWRRAWDVEKVTQRFFKDYKAIFEEVRDKRVQGIRDKNARHEFTQRLFNRLMFCWFLQMKGWLNHDHEYLLRLFEEAAARGSKKNFYDDYLHFLFFWALRNPSDTRMTVDGAWKLREMLGETPFLNGGLFDEEEPYDVRGAVKIENATFGKIFNDLFKRYNFTVEENTALDVRVAVDPEMLGKVFEELVIERSEKGSYYTPRVIVNAMCKSSLRAYLLSQLSFRDATEKVDALLFQHDVGPLESTREAREVADALDRVRICDPAVGSGAFLVGMLHELVDLNRLLFNEKLNKPKKVYDLKREIIQNNLYGADLDRFAVNIAMLRLWLSLAVDHEVEDIGEVQPLPNLLYKVRCGDSLTAHVGGQVTMDYDGRVRKLVGELQVLKKDYFALSDERKRTLQQQIDGKEAELAEALGEDHEDAGSVLWDAHFGEIFVQTSEQTNHRGFDIVIANPPYGLKLDFPQRFGLQNKDSYGMFLVRGFELTKHNGVLCYIMSDTWETIKTHRPLRKFLLDNAKVLHLAHVPFDVFKATVNTSVLTAQKLPGVALTQQRQENDLIAADLTRASTESGELERALEAVVTGQPDAVSLIARDDISIPRRIAAYRYTQKLVRTYSGGLPFFLGSPKLFRFMSDSDASSVVRKKIGLLTKVEVEVRFVEMNGEVVEVVRLGDIAEIKQGMSTGENDYYLRKRQGSPSNRKYELVAPDKVLTSTEIERLCDDEKANGIRSNRCFIPYDLLVPSETEDGSLPGYYVPTDFFIDWSRAAVKRMRTLTIAERRRLNSEKRAISPRDEMATAALIRASEFFFRPGIVYARSGTYCPTFRVASGTIFDAESSFIYSEVLSVPFLLGVFCSRLFRYACKAFVDHTKHCQVDELKELPIAVPETALAKEIESLVTSIIAKQKENPRYDYQHHEQIEIDALVYELYRLDAADVAEVETWYARRYPRLAAAQQRWARQQEDITLRYRHSLPPLEAFMRERRHEAELEAETAASKYGA